MVRFSFARQLFIFSLLILMHHATRSQRPNILYIMTDDMGYGDLSSYGRKDYQTPNLDKLASQGIKFVNAYSAGSLCTPTRTAFMTGRYPARTPVGLIEPLTPTKKDSAYGLTTEYPSIATMMRESGYETALIGKWHLGFRPEHSPTQNGFEYFFGFHSGAADYISHRNSGRLHDLYENDSLVYPDGYLTDIFSQKAASFIKQKHDKPFFLVLTYNAPHWPWQGPGDKAYEDTMGFKSGGSPVIYAAMMKGLDDGVGTVMKALDDAGVTQNTIVIFTNDNGGEIYSDNGGLSKAKYSLWEGGIRVPAFVRWPGKIKPGAITDQVAITMDWPTTMLAIAGTKAKEDFPLDGINLAPILTGKKNVIERTLYWRTFQRQKQKAIREGNWKYLQDDKGEYLFNIARDPSEKNDLKDTEKEIFERLKKKFSKWEKTVLTPIPL